MTYDEIGDQVESWIDDDQTGMRAIIDDQINNVYSDLLYDEIRPNWWLLKYDTFGTVDAQQIYDDTGTDADNIAQDIRRIVAISVNGSPLSIIDDPEEIEMYASKFHDSTQKDAPHSCFHQKAYNGDGTELNRLWLMLTPDAAYSASYWYEKRVPKLVNPADVPQLPGFAHQALVWGTLIVLSLLDISIKSVPYLKLYERVDEQLNRHRRSKHAKQYFTSITQMQKK